MKPWIKIAIGVVAGFGAGFGSGFLFHKRMNDVQFEEVSEEEMAQYEKSTIEKQEKSDILSNEKEARGRGEELPADPDELKKTLQGKVSYVAADQESKVKYSQMWNGIREYSNEENANQIPVPQDERDDTDENAPDGEEFDEDFMKEIEKEDAQAPGETVPPHPIMIDDFYNDRPEYDKITIEWYEPDNTLVDEKEEVIADHASYVGAISIKELFAETKPGEDPDIRFIRNEGYGTDYEIIRHHRSWRETNGE